MNEHEMTREQLLDKWNRGRPVHVSTSPVRPSAQPGRVTLTAMTCSAPRGAVWSTKVVVSGFDTDATEAFVERLGALTA